jgi:non-specific serine/threonine protein kinase
MLELSRTGPVVADAVGAGLTAMLEGLYAFFAEGRAESIAVLRSAVSAFEEAGPQYRGERSTALLYAGMAANWYGSSEDAHQLTAEYVADTTAAGAEWAFAWSHLTCGLAVTWHGDPNDLPPIAPPRQQPGDHWGLMYLMHLVAWAGAATIKQRSAPAPTADRDAALRIARALGSASRLRERYGVTISMLPPFRDADADAESAAVAVLGVDTFAETFSAVQALGYDDIAALVSNQEPAVPAPQGAGQARPWNDLTATEQEVARLAAEGLSDAQIARRRVCSVRTVEKHLENVRRKLTVDSRRGIAQWVPES